MRILQDKLDDEHCLDFVLDKCEWCNLNEYLPINGEVLVDGQILSVCIRLNFNEAEYEDF